MNQILLFDILLSDVHSYLTHFLFSLYGNSFQPKRRLNQGRLDRGAIFDIFLLFSLFMKAPRSCTLGDIGTNLLLFFSNLYFVTLAKRR